MYYIEDFNIREIAQILDITEGAVQKRLARARGKLRCNLRESEAANMRFEDMKNNIPETPEFIHVMIQNEVDRQLQGTTIIQIPKKRKK